MINPPQSMQPPQQGMAPQGPAGPPGPGPQGPPGMPPQPQQAQQPPEGQPLAAQPNPPTPPDPEKRINALMEAAITSKNLVANLDDDDQKLCDMAEFVRSGYEADLESVSGWMSSNREWLKLALLMRENKSYPWVNASNVKYPLLSTAAMQFSARAYPTLVPSDNQIVKGRVIGYDPDGTRADRSDRISKHMSYQIMYKIPNWEENMDRLLNLTSIVGVVFKKTYRDTERNTVCSKLVYPEDLIINYGATSIEDAYRKTEILRYTPKVYKEKVRAGFFRDIGDIGLAPTAAGVPSEEKPNVYGITQSSTSDESTPHIFLSMHTFYDIDGDDYPEPVEIIMHKESGKIVRAVARFSMEGVTMDAKGKKIVRIDPIEYFTDFPFLPNPDGSIYGLGFGILLGPINEAINSLINQLVDAGTLNNMQSGFIGKGLRLQMKETKFVPGEWKAVNATGDDLKKSIFPLPSKEPSAVLFQLMNLLIQSGNQLASVAEIFVGKMPGQNTPATTTQETVDQAMKVFTAIYKRIYRALLKEFQKVYHINRLSPGMVQEEAQILNIQLSASDYDGPEDEIIPAADPAGASSTTQMQQMAQIGQQLLPMGVINAQEYASRILKYANVPDPEKLVQQPPPPPPDPKAQTEQLKQQTMQQKGQMDQQKGQQALQMKQTDIQIKQQLADMEERKQQMDIAFKEHTMKLDAAAKAQELAMKRQIAQFKMILQQHQDFQNLKTNALLNQQKVVHGEQSFQQKQRQQAQQQKVKKNANNKGRSGSVAS